MRIRSWLMTSVGEPLVPDVREETPGPGEVLVEVRGCGICHTDLGFLFEGIPTRHPLPLTLGHEISGRVVAAGAGEERWLDQDVVVPAVIPCGTCRRCRAGRPSICRSQVFPGNDVHGGFASHVRVPARGLCPVPPLDGDVTLAELAVLADAVTTPYQSIQRSGLSQGDLAVFVGVGGVGAFGVQIARALGATVVAVDVDEERLELVQRHGAALTLPAGELTPRELRRGIGDFAREHRLPESCWKIFETSGTRAGQETAFGLLTYGAYLGVVGYTPEPVTVRLSNLMAFDACAEGNWGCDPALYPEALALVLQGHVKVRPFVETRPMSGVNEALEGIHRHAVKRRVVLVPDFEER